MRFITRLFRRGNAAHASPDSALHSRPRAPGHRGGEHAKSQHQEGLRRNLLRVTVRETLRRNGLPAEWIGAEVQPMQRPDGVEGLQLTLVIRHWDARLPTYLVALQHSMETRLLQTEPAAGSWLLGISWVYRLPANAPYPKLPHPGSWTAPTDAADDGSAIAPKPLAPAAQVRAELDLLFANLPPPQAPPDFAATLPMSAYRHDGN